MMRNVITFLCFIFLSLLQAQDAGEITFDQASLPSSPAFILLDNAPSVIERPDTPKAFGIQLLQDFEDGILDDIAVEFTPFWYLRPEKLTALDMRGIEKTEGGFKQKPFAPLRFVSVSAAYMKSMDSITNVSIGARTTLIEIKHKKDIDRLVKANARVESILKSIIILRNEFIAIPGNAELKENDREAYDEALTAYIKLQKLESAKQVYDALNIKPVFALDAAVAYNARFTNDVFESGNQGLFGVWATAAYAQPLGRAEFSKNYLNAYGFVRYLNDQLGAEKFNALDLGLKAELEFNKFSFAYEYISRSGDLDTYRSSGSLAYKISNNLYLTGAFGNNFGDTDDLISLFGIRWGLNAVGQILN